MRKLFFIFLATFLATQSAEAGKGVYFKIWNESSYNFNVTTTASNWDSRNFTSVSSPVGSKPDDSYYTEVEGEDGVFTLNFSSTTGNQNLSWTFSWQQTGGAFNPGQGNLTVYSSTNASMVSITDTIKACDPQMCVLLVLQDNSKNGKQHKIGKEPSVKRPLKK